jgi:mycothiol system anti-sigma-R factor
MSCGQPHELDCHEVLRRADVFLEHRLDGDLSVAEQPAVSFVRIEQHLHECHPCERQYEGAVYQLDEQVRAAVLRCCHEDHAPDDLRSRVLRRLAELQAERRPEPR